MSDSGTNGRRSSTASSSQAFKALFDISVLLNTGLDGEELRLCTKLVEAGVNPQALAMVVKELQQESRSFRSQTPAHGGGQPPK